MDPIERLRTAGKRVGDPLESMAQHVAERAVDLVLNAVDLNEVMQRVDLNALLARVDMNALLSQVDLNALLGQIDVNDLLGKIDMDALVEETDLGRSSPARPAAWATEALDAARSASVGLDQFIDRWVQRALRRKQPTPLGRSPTLTALALTPTARLPRRAQARPWTARTLSADSGSAHPGTPDRQPGQRERLRGEPGRSRGQPGHDPNGEAELMSTRSLASQGVSAQGHYAGSVSRFVGYAIDLAVSSGLFSLALATISYVAKIVSGHDIAWSRDNIVVAIVFVAWEFFYFGYSWAMSGRTFGMAVLGIKVVQADGQIIRPRQGVVRSLAFPLSFLLFGLGFLGILVAA